MSFFSSADAFGMIRGGHIDVTVLGALQVSERGDLANWMLPQRGIGNVGGAMDLVAGARRVIVAMEHTDRSGTSKIVRECTYPLTGRECVSLIVTDIAVMEVSDEGLVLKEVAPDWDAALRPGGDGRAPDRVAGPDRDHAVDTSLSLVPHRRYGTLASVASMKVEPRNMEFAHIWNSYLPEVGIETGGNEMNRSVEERRSRACTSPSALARISSVSARTYRTSSS